MNTHRIWTVDAERHKYMLWSTNATGYQLTLTLLCQAEERPTTKPSVPAAEPSDERGQLEEQWSTALDSVRSITASTPTASRPRAKQKRRQDSRRVARSLPR